MTSPVCAALDANSSLSASAIVADAVTGSHLLHVEGYSRTRGVPNGMFIRSRPFKVGGCSWCISYYPNGARPNHADFISVFLALDETVAQPMKVHAKFSLLNQVSRQGPSHTRTTALLEYSDRTSGYGYDLIKREFLEKSEYLKDDSIKIKCDVIISKEIHTEDRTAAPPFVVVPSSDMHIHFSNLLATEDGADVKFKVDGETFRAHRYILAVRSPVFKAELLGAMRESTAATGDCIQIDDMVVEVFKSLLHFIYNDSLPEMEGQEEALMAQHLLEAADRYDMQRLKLICEDKLCNHLEVSTVATTLALAEQHNCQGLKEACIEFLISPDALEAVMATDGFEHLTKSCPSLVKELMSELGTRLYKRRKLRA